MRQQLVAAPDYRGHMLLFRRTQYAEPAEEATELDAAADLRQRNRQEQACERRREPGEQRRRDQKRDQADHDADHEMRPMEIPRLAPRRHVRVTTLRVPSGVAAREDLDDVLGLH